MKKVCFFALFLFSASVAYSQNITLPFSFFNGIDVFGPFDVELIKSETESVEIDYNGIDKDDVVIEMSRGFIKMKLKNRHYFNEWDNQSQRKSDYVRVKVYYNDMDMIEARAGATVTSSERLKSKYLNIESTMGAEVKLDVLTKELQTKTSMGGIVELIGQTERLDVSASMGGVLKASQLESKVVFVKATMGAEIVVNVIDELEVSSAFGSSVDYIGGPAVRHTSKSMGGEVRRKGD